MLYQYSAPTCQFLDSSSVNRNSLSASSRALTFPLSLLRVSMYSSSSTLSYTIPPPACRYAVPSLKVIVRMAIQVSISSSAKSNRPTAPAYTPRRSCSSEEMISMALILGAPDTVPAGKIDRNASNLGNGLDGS